MQGISSKFVVEKASKKKKKKVEFLNVSSVESIYV